VSERGLYPADMKGATIRALVDRAADRAAAEAFLLSPETGAEITFAALKHNCLSVHRALNELGMPGGAKVAYMLPNGLWTAQLLLGIMYSGRVAVPVDVAAGETQVRSVVVHSDADVVFASQNHLEFLRAAFKGLDRPVGIVRADPDAGPARETIAVEPPPVGEDDDALLVYTSGSTGRPKGVLIPHRSLVAGGFNVVNSHRLTASDRSLCVLPLYHMNAQIVTLIPTLESGGSVVMPRRFAVARFWEWVRDYRCTWFSLVPTIIAQLLSRAESDRETARAAAAHVRFGRSASAPLPASHMLAFEEEFGIPMIEAMGITESCSVIFSNPLPPETRKPGSPGVPCGFEARIVDADGRELEQGRAGHIQVRSESMMKGYYKDPENTAKAITADGWLRTGDMGYRDADGYFFITGRAKEIILKGGESIAPRDIDEALTRHPAVLEAAAVGVDDPFMGEDIAAFVRLREGITCTEEELAAFSLRELGPVKTPSRIHFVEELPKGPSGKIQRLKLRETAASAAAPAVLHAADARAGEGRERAFTEPRTAVERMLSEIWSEHLGVSRLSIHDNFFDLGGYSLLAARVVSRIREKFAVSLPLRVFFERPTLAEQAVLVVQAMVEKSGGDETLSLLENAEKSAPLAEADGGGPTADSA